MKYVIYLRVSTDQQAQSGLGLESQKDICLRYINNNPKHSEYIEFSDLGYSGALDIERRPGLIKALDSLTKDDVLLIAKRDRLGRDSFVNAMIERLVDRKKARIVSASGDVRDDNDPSSLLMRRMIDAFAEYERLIIGQRTKEALSILKKHGKRTGYIPYGYELDIDQIHIRYCEHEQNTLRIIQEFKYKGISLRNIAKELNDRNLFNRQGLPWNHVSVMRVSEKFSEKNAKRELILQN